MTGKGLAGQWFEAYLAERKLEGGDDHHPDLGDRRRPDYRISSEGVSAICEVKEFTMSIADRRMAGSAGGVLSGHHFYGTPRNTVGKAAKNQLRPFADRGEPLIVVLANPRSAFVPLEEAHDVIAMMYGNPGVAVSLDGRSPNQAIFMEDGVFGGNRHRYVSAVVTLHRRERAADAKDDWLDCNEHQWNGFNDRQRRTAAMVEALQHPSLRTPRRPPARITSYTSMRPQGPSPARPSQCHAVSSAAHMTSSGR